MARSSQFNEVMLELEQLVRRGDAVKAIERLNLLLASHYPSETPESAYICRLLSFAFRSINEQNSAKVFLGRTVAILSKSDSNFDQAEILMLLAEDLSHEKLHNEAVNFAESSIEMATTNLDRFHPEDVAVLLRRYAAITATAGDVASSHIALSIGMIIVSRAAGVDSDVADDLERLVRNNFVKDKKGVSAIGNYYLGQHALN